MVALDKAIWEKYIGLPFRHRGRGPDTYDCYGLLMALYKDLGIDIHEVTYGIRPSEQTDIISHEREASWIPCEVKPGVCLLFRDQFRGAAHVGMAIDDDRFIHASYEFGQTLVSRLSAHNGLFQKRLIGAFEYAVRR